MAGKSEKKDQTVQNNAAQRLQSYIDRIERLEEEKRALSADIADIKQEAKSAGFDTKVLNQMLKERRMESAERSEFQALCEVYRAALGMLDGTPLGEHARQRLMGKHDQPDDQQSWIGQSPDGAGPNGEDVSKIGSDIISEDEAKQIDQASDKKAPPVPSVDPLAARAQGAAAAKAGHPVTANPFAAGDPCRAAFDEGWCAAAVSDGMDIPAAWRRSPKKKGDDEPKGASA